MKVVWVLTATTFAVAAQTTLNRWFTVSGVVDLALIVVVYHALASGRVAGMLTGSLAGLLQDAMSGGIIGMAGLSKTVVGFLAGIIGTQFIVTHTVSRFVVFFGATIAHAVVYLGLYALLGMPATGSPFAAVLIQAFGNAFVGVVAFQAVESLPGVLERRSQSRGHTKR